MFNTNRKTRRKEEEEMFNTNRKTRRKEEEEMFNTNTNIVAISSSLIEETIQYYGLHSI